ncbi:MAG: TolC family protein [Bacteroidota bacterium]
MSCAQEVLPFEEYLSTVKANHPSMKQANNLELLSRAQDIASRGPLDPRIQGGVYRKEFDQKLYYDEREVKLIIPTKWGLDIESLYQNNQGEFLDNSAFLPENGLLAAGISMPILRGLFFDERRRSLRNAELLSGLNSNEQRLQINKLIENASKAYVDWQTNFLLLQIADEGVRLAELTRDFTVQSFQLGDLAAVDTLEANLAIQNRTLQKTDAEIKYVMSTLHLNNFLWSPEGEQWFIVDQYVPEDMSLSFFRDSIGALINDSSVILNHPKLKKLNIKKGQTELDKKLASEYLKPVLNFKYQPLFETIEWNELAPASRDAYTLGINFELPILNRKYRGKRKELEFKILNYSLEIDNEKRGLEVLFNQFQNIETLLGNQLQNARQAASGYEALTNAERTKFEIGESSLFLVNRREAKFLEMQFKATEVHNELLKNRLSFFYTMIF